MKIIIFTIFLNILSVYNYGGYYNIYCGKENCYDGKIILK